MKIQLFPTILGCALLSAGHAFAAEMTRLDAVPGGAKVRIEGTSTVHDWQVESKIIGGYLEAGPNFPLEPGQEVKPGPVEAKVDAFIPVRSLKSIEKDGSPYSDKMNEVMYEHMKQTNSVKIAYRVTELVLKEPPKSKDLPYIFDSKGELVVAGVTNKISMPVNVTPLGGKKVKITGNTTAKMSDFKMEPPKLIGLLTTGDDVKLFFEWTVQQKSAAAAATKQ